ncbi:hypothetical protein PORCAN_361 [Porphyromonas crevioricanis JCM 13913]|nr:hypothetical protein PORCAN_361 [Porphyromonas crevioricanis JCM 13913]
MRDIAFVRNMGKQYFFIQMQKSIPREYKKIRTSSLPGVREIPPLQREESTVLLWQKEVIETSFIAKFVGR